MVGAADDEHAQRAARSARVAAVVRKLRHARFGLIGQLCPGMIDTGCDEAALERCLGATVVHRDLDNVLAAAQASDPAEAATLAGELAARVGRVEVDRKTVEEGYRLFLGMRTLVEADRLDGFAIRCWPELRDQHRTPACLTLAEMAERGIANACEADITALVTSYVLTQLAGAPSYSLEITAYLEDQRALQLAHCGAAPLKLAGDPKQAALRGHMRTGAGALVEFPFPAGRVTIAKLLRPSEGGMRMFVARGEALPTEAGVRGSVATIRPEPSPEALLDRMLREAVEHHLVVAYGDWTGELAHFARFAGIELIRP
jgi:L-fucose isomerase-like protein